MAGKRGGTLARRPHCANPECKRQFLRPVGSARKYCFTCRPPVDRKSDPVPSEGEDAAPEPGKIEAESIRELAMAGRLESLEAEVVLRLARAMDSPATSGSQLASLAPKLLEARRVALAGFRPDSDRLDELEARRRAKIGGGA